MHMDSMSVTRSISLHKGMLGSDRYQKCVYDMHQRKLYVCCFSLVLRAYTLGWFFIHLK